MIRAEHIIKSFEGRTVLKDISATFETGKTNLIIGQSGSGKTVLLKSLVGLHTIDSGKIFYDDICYTTLSFKERKAIRQQIGMIFQGGALLDSSTVEENVRLPLDLFTDQSASEKADRVNFCLQRVNLPNSGLDPMTSVVIDNLIKEITEEYNITTIINTHDMNSVLEIGEHVIFIYKGEKWWEGTKHEILHADNRELNEFVFASSMAKRAKACSGLDLTATKN